MKSSFKKVSNYNLSHYPTVSKTLPETDADTILKWENIIDNVDKKFRNRSSQPGVFCKKTIRRNPKKIIRKYLQWSLFKFPMPAVLLRNEHHRKFVL